MFPLRSGLLPTHILRQEQDPHWVLEDAASIDDKGQIAGFGLHDGKLRAFVLTPR